MPNRDGTGPMGNGARRGRGVGNAGNGAGNRMRRRDGSCNRMVSDCEQNQMQGQGRGRGRGMAGNGMGRRAMGQNLA